MFLTEIRMLYANFRIKGLLNVNFRLIVFGNYLQK